MRPLRIASAVALGLLGLALPTSAQKADSGAEPRESARFSSLERLNAYYDDQFLELDRRRIADLTALASKAQMPEAELAYQEAFNLAVTRELYDAAEKAAIDCLASDKISAPTRTYAHFIRIMAATSRSKYNEALENLGQFLKSAATTANAANGNNPNQLDPSTYYAIGEALLQRLEAAGEYEIARRVADLFVTSSLDQNIKGHFNGRLGRINMVGQPAPPIAGKGVDDELVSLADLKGKVVLIDFFATWTPNSTAQISQNNALYAKYQDKGFTILGIDMDAMLDQYRGDPSRVLPNLRRYLVAMRVAWPVLVNGHGQDNYAKAYNVNEVPATFLVGRDGKILHVELQGSELDQAIAKALREPAPAGSAAPPGSQPAAKPAPKGR
ncbi:MAG: TlpA family protein disulfide reductase [Isosphaeraceae bacterium]|nr:TlpA family protein disulfide reductase [Isosphaeraceae bacterium]